jgi:hypothetical protein
MTMEPGRHFQRLDFTKEEAMKAKLLDSAIVRNLQGAIHEMEHVPVIDKPAPSRSQGQQNRP